MSAVSKPNFEDSYVYGVQNLLDQYPVDNPWAGIAGAKYGERGPYGFNGGFYYAKVRMTW